MSTDNKNYYNVSMLSVGFSKKPSLARYSELRDVFPNVLIFFEHSDFYYGFDETAVALYCLFGCHYCQKKGMLVVKVEKDKFESHMVAKRRMRGFRYLIDRNGIVSFEKGTKGFCLKRSLSYYADNLNSLQNKKSVSSFSTTSHGFGWHDDAWTPGLPSSRMYRNKEKSASSRNRKCRLFIL